MTVTAVTAPETASLGAPVGGKQPALVFWTAACVRWCQQTRWSGLADPGGPFQATCPLKKNQSGLACCT